MFVYAVQAVNRKSLAVALQQLLFGGDDERAVFGREHDGQTDVVLLGRRGSPHDG